MTYATRNWLTLALVAVLSTGCSLVVGFDRSRVGDGGGTDAGPSDAGDAGVDGGSDAGPSCSNGAEDTGEACDDGNLTDGDGCSATCTIEDGFECTGFGAGTCSAICGDGMMVGDEVCDDGFTTACGACNADCTAVGSTVVCGDDVTCTDTEACDDGNTVDGDGCTMDCSMIETGWVCTMDEPSVCAMTCGNGMIDMGETCDDGNNTNGDGCAAACQAERGYMCVGAPSVCSTTCGDGMLAGDETCDDGNTADGDGCTGACDALEDEWICTDEVSTMPATMPDTTCVPRCGDNIMVTGEACDDGNETTELACPYGMASCTLCNADCSMELTLTGNVCGDGVVDAVNETCDVGTPVANDGCSDTCQAESGYTCTGAPSTCVTTCGDGVIAGSEVCDDNSDDGIGCAMGCGGDATGWNCSGAPLSVCSEICGDGMVVGSEMCDDGNMDACGLCQSTTCASAPVTYAAATGSITVGPGNLTGDGDSFTLDDGVNPAVTFEMDSDATCTETATNRCVVFLSANSADVVAGVVAAAIRAAAIDITAPAPAANVISLTNATLGGAGNGAGGNVAITSSGFAGGSMWAFTGMDGGVARDCAMGRGCTSPDDCASGSCTGTCS